MVAPHRGRGSAAAASVRRGTTGFRLLLDSQSDRPARADWYCRLRHVRQQHVHDRDQRHARGRAALHPHGRDHVPLGRDEDPVRLARPAGGTDSRPAIRPVHPAVGHPGSLVGRRHGGCRTAWAIIVSDYGSARIRPAPVGWHDHGGRVPRPDHSAERAGGHHRDHRQRFPRLDAHRRHPAWTAADGDVPGVRGGPRLARSEPRPR